MVAASVLAAAVLVWSCGLFIAPEHGTLVLSFSAQILLTAKTIEPTLDMEAAYCDVSGSGPGGASFEQVGVTDTTVAQASLIPGEWIIEVDAYNDAETPTLIGEGSAVDFTNAGDDLSASYASPAPGSPDALENGYYTLTLTLQTDRPEGTGSDVVWGTIERGLPCHPIDQP